jgi:tRNA(Ile)-lysidine synthase
MTRELLEEDDAAIEAWLAELLPRRAMKTLDFAPLKGKPRALLRRALHRWLLRQSRAGKLSRQGFDALLGAIERGRPTRQSLGTKGFAVIVGDRLEFRPVGNKSRGRR